MSEALEFVAPLNVSATNFNRNPRKLRILQVKFPESDSLEPLVVGTYPVNPITGTIVPQGNPFYPAPNYKNYIPGATTGAALIPTSVLQTVTQDVRIYRLCVYSDTANNQVLLKYKSGSAIELLNAFQVAGFWHDIRFEPHGFSLIDLGIAPNAADIAANGTLTLNLSVGGASKVTISDMEAYVA